MNQQADSSDARGDGRSKAQSQTPWAKSSAFSGNRPLRPDPSEEGPGGRPLRVFWIVLILHIVAVGGILAFKLVEGTIDAIARDSVKSNAGSETAPGANRTPAKGNLQRPDMIVDDPSRLGFRHYRVRSGDNLLSVARRLGVSISELESINGLDQGKSLRPGMILLIPGDKIQALPPEDVDRLLTKPAEAEVPKAPAEEARRVTPVVLRPAPPPAPAAATAPPRAPELIPRALPVGRKYIVVAGDTPYGIARRFGINHHELMRANGISDPRMLQAGQEIIIPAGR